MDERADVDFQAEVSLNRKYYCCQKPILRIIGLNQALIDRVGRLPAASLVFLAGIKDCHSD